MRFLALLAAVAIMTTQPTMTHPHEQKRSAYLGFDRNEYPGDDNLGALRKSFVFTGYWLNAPPGDAQTTWSGKRQLLEDAGFGFAILFNGRLYHELQGKNAAAIGRGDGAAAVSTAKREGFPSHAVIFLDQEEGGRLLPEQKAYLFAWADAVEAGGFRAGVYCSGIEFVEDNGARVITARDIRENAGGRAIAFWVSNDACPPAPGCTFAPAPRPLASGVSFAEVWQFAQSPRRPDQTVRCARTYAPDGNCYPPDIASESGLHIDVSSANSADPSHGRRQSPR